MLFGALLTLDVEEGLGAGGVTGDTGSVGAGGVVGGSLVVGVARTVTLTEAV